MTVIFFYDTTMCEFFIPIEAFSVVSDDKLNVYFQQSFFKYFKTRSIALLHSTKKDKLKELIVNG